MRTRFLGTDHFSLRSEDQTHWKSLFTPLYLPTPDLFDPDPERDFRNPRFDDEIRLESDFGELPMSKALSDLFSDLIPQFRQVEIPDQNALSKKELADFLYGESKDAGFREDASLFKKIPNDVIGLDDKIAIPYQEELLESLYKVEKVPLEFDHAESYSKNAISYMDVALSYIPKVPQFELRDVDWDQNYEKPISKTETCDSLLSFTELCSYDHPRDVSWTKEEKAQVQKEGNSGDKSKTAVPDTSSGKASMLFESMSQNSDLNFFLGAIRGVARKGIVDGESVSTEKITMSKEPTKPAAVLIEPTPPFTVLKEPTKPDILEDPQMKVRNLFQDPNNTLSEKRAIYLQNLLPTKEKVNSISFEPANANPALNIPSFISSKTRGSTKPPVPGVVVVVNTQCLNKPMLVSRRSSYQKILALEKEGAHVLERDINLPLDLVLSAGDCLVWYEIGAFGNISRNMTDGPSCTQIFMDNIATNVLISLSYSFSSCIMILEGEADLLAVVMGQSDTFYSAAAYLDINLQLLFSDNPKSTDELIVKCITKFTGPTQGLYPPMPESETLAEYFLTKFPSINPLSAHAILSTGGALIDFLGWSNEHRIQACGKYLVPDESIALFSALCRYGEMRESKSVMTDCLSVESDTNSSLLQSPPKRKRFANEIVDAPMDGTSTISFEQFQGDFMGPHVENQPKKSVSTIIDQFVKRKKGFISCVPGNCGEVETGQPQLLDQEQAFMSHSRNVFYQEQAFMSDILSLPLRPESRIKPPVRSSLHTKGPDFSDYSFCTFSISAEMEDETTDKARRYQGQGSKEAAKRIDKYRYPGGGKDAIDPLRPKWKDFNLQQTPFPTTAKRKTSTPRNPSWTPVEKRARQNLSFTRYGKDKQSKLVWRRKDSPCTSISLGKRSKEEDLSILKRITNNLELDTMKLIVKTPGSSSLQDLLHVICHSAEISGIQLEINERTLNKIHTDKEERLRFHLLGGNGKRKKQIMTKEEKIFVFANDCLTGDPLIQDLSLSQEASTMCSNGCRIANCMKEYFIYKKSYKAAINSLLLAKCLCQKLWDSSPFLLKQLPAIELATAKALQSAGISNFESLEAADPRKIEILTGRNYPFGNQIMESLQSLPPKIVIHVEEVVIKRGDEPKVAVTLTCLERVYMSNKYHYADMVVGSEEDNTILFHEKIRAEEFSSPYSFIVSVPCPENARVTLKIHIVYEEYVGLDAHAKHVMGEAYLAENDDTEQQSGTSSS